MHRLAVLVALAALALTLVPPTACAAETADHVQPVELHLLDIPSPASLTESVAAETDVSRVKKNVELRLKMVKAHRVLGMVSLVTMFTAQSFGLVNRIALAEGVPRKDLEPTLMLHRVFVGSSLITYFGAGGIALGMPGPGGDRASKKLSGGPKVMRNVHVGMSIAHAIALAITGTTGILQSYVARDTPAWEPLVTTHQIAASTAAGLMMGAVIIIQSQ